MSAAAEPDLAREQAREILEGGRYRPTELPRPFEGALEWLGRQLRPVTDAWDAASGWLLDAPLPLQLLALGLVIGVIASLASRLARLRSGPEGDATRRRRRGEPSVDAGALERAAERAEAEGDYERALRLRFRAGLVRLDSAGLVVLRPSLTSGELSRMLRREPFDRLARRHDEVVYGGRPATPVDIEEARRSWPELVRSR